MGSDMDGGAPPRNSGAQSSSALGQQARILEALRRVQASRAFANAKKLLALLEFLVSSVLRGEEAGLKETSVGVAFYGRDPSYDPKKDSIVRTQASRLRDRLEEYYRTEGSSDPVTIELGRGSYIPVFHYREPEPKAEKPSAPPAAPVAQPSISKPGRRGLKVLGAASGVAAIAAIVLWVSMPLSRG